MSLITKIPMKEWKKLTAEQQQAIIAKRKKGTKVAKTKKTKKVVSKQKKQKNVSLSSKSFVDRAKMTDPRYSEFSSNLSSANQSAIENPAVTYEVPITSDVLTAAIYSAATFALSRGWQASAALPDYPYWAVYYGTQVLVSYVTNATVQTPEVPLWLNVIGNFLMPKTKVQFGSGAATYTFAIDDATPSPGATIPLGPLPYARFGLLYVPNTEGTPINGLLYPMAPPNAYNEDNGKKAWASMCQFLGNVHNQKDPRSKMHKMVASNMTTRFIQDPSSFANTVPTPGGGASNTGGIGTQISGEVPIFSPLMSVFHTSSTTVGGDPARYPRYTRTGAGDVLSSVGQLVHAIIPKQIQKKAIPALKPVDFNEFGEVLGYWASYLSQEYINDPQNVAVGDNAAIVNLQFCPLTLQEMLLCLRGVMMNLFKDTQFMAQGLYPIAPTGSNDNQFVAFCAGTGQGPYPGVTDMLLPLSLVENMRALTARANYGGKGGISNPQLWIPILGKNWLDDLDEDQFVITTFDGTSGVSVFKPAASADMYIVVGKDGKREKHYGAEIAVSLIDGKSGSVFYGINDPGALNVWIEEWNKWVTSLRSFSCTLTTVGTDGGINVLDSSIMTRYWTPQFQPETDKNKRKSKEIEKIRPKLGRFSGVADDENSPYNSRGILAVTSHNMVFDQAWETILQHWILPIQRSFTGATLNTFNNFNRIRALYGEPHTLTFVENETETTTLQISHSKYARLMVRARNSLVDMHEKFLKECEAKGRGGILSSLASSLLGPILGPEGSKVVNGIASVLPF